MKISATVILKDSRFLLRFFCNKSNRHELLYPCISALFLCSELCLAQEALISKDWIQQNVGGCNKFGVASLLRQYQCVELQPSCGTFSCNVHVPPEVIVQIQQNCNNVITA